MDVKEAALELHKKHHGKLAIQTKIPVTSQDDLSLVYTPGVAAPCQAIADDAEKAYDYTIKGNSIAVVSDGSAVLGMGNIGGQASMPVMEGKALIMKEMADLDAYPICLSTQDDEEIIKVVKAIAPTFGGVNLEDISAPRCFKIEAALQDLGIPVMHDDQHGTAIVALAALINASKVLKKPLSTLKVVVNGAGAAGTAITKLLMCRGIDANICTSVKDIIMCDSKSIIHKERPDLSEHKQLIAGYTNVDGMSGSVHDAIKGADVFIGVSKANLLTAEDVATMNSDAIIIAMANPVPEIMPDEAKKGGATVIGTGRSDFPNQINNSLAFPGLFRGALDAKATKITEEMKIAAAHAIAACVEPTVDNILPYTLDKSVVPAVAKAVKETAEKQGVVRN